MSETTIGRGTGIAPENLQEVLEASKNGAAGQSAFFTPLEFAKLCAHPLPNDRNVLTDLSGGSGQLLIGAANETTRMGLICDIENCRTKFTEKWPHPEIIRIAGDCCKIYELLQEVSFRADCFALNPPWNLHWHKQNLAKLAESDVETVRQAFSNSDSLSGPDAIDSTVATMMIALDLMSNRGEGFLIANDATLERLIFKDGAPYSSLAPHVWARAILKGNPMTGEAKQTFDKEKDFETGVIWFAVAHIDGLDRDATFRADDLSEFAQAVEQIRMRRHRLRSGVSVMARYNLTEGCDDIWKSVRTEWDIRQGKRKPDYNIWLSPSGSIETYLSVFDNKSVKIPKHEAVSLFELNGKMAMELVMMRTERQLLLHHVNGGIWRVHPDLPKQVEEAVGAYYAARAPLYPLNPIQSLGFVDESETLECKIDMRLDSKDRLETPAEKIINECSRLKLTIHYQKYANNPNVYSIELLPVKKAPKELLASAYILKQEIADYQERQKGLKGFDGVLFRAGKAYKVRTQTVLVSRTTEKPGLYGEDHEIYLRGQELAIFVKDETGIERCFMDRRHASEDVTVEGEVENKAESGYVYNVTTEMHPDFDLETIAKHFAIPTAPDVGLCQPEKYKSNLQFLDSLEELVGNGFRFKSFQRRDLSRAGLHDGLILGFVPGLGKTLAGIAWALMKVGLHPQANGTLLPAAPVLIVAPENLHAQMIQDYGQLFGAAMPEVIELDSQETFLKLSPLKPGWYISSFTQIAMNKVRSIPSVPENNGMDDGALAVLMKFFGVRVQDAVEHKLLDEDKRLLSVHDRALNLCQKRRLEWVYGVGEEKAGIKCLYSPSLADLVRHQFEAVIIDEAVRIKAEDSIVGVGVRSLDPKYRLVLTGTPIKNRLPDIFFLSAWACDALDAANARWPYHGNKEGEMERFAEEFMVMGRDLTKERKEAEARGGTYTPPDRSRRSKQRKGRPTAEVCNVHRLWKLLAPVVLRRLKKDIGEDIVPKIKKPIYVPMGKDQAKVYAYHLKAAYLDKNGMPAIGAQLQALRNCAAAPHSDLLMDKHGECDENGKPTYIYRSTKDYIPKLAACMTVIEEILARREQVVVFSAFHEPLDTLSRYLTKAGIAHDVLDGRMSAGRRGQLAMEFKLGLPSAKPVLLAGNKAMAEGNSWNLCNNAILYAFDWAYDLFAQAIDRVHRLNSRKPVNIYPIICQGTIDRKLESMIDEKADATELVLDGAFMGEQIEEVNLAALLNIAHLEFTAEKAIPEEDCLASWPALCAKLVEANKNLLAEGAAHKAEQEAQSVVVETLREPTKRILDLSKLPAFGPSLFRFV